MERQTRGVLKSQLGFRGLPVTGVQLDDVVLVTYHSGIRANSGGTR